MTDHEWVDWVIKKTKEGHYQWSSIEEDALFGVHYKGKTPRERDNNSSRERYKEYRFIFKPRPDKTACAELLVYEERNRLLELTPADRKRPEVVKFYERKYNPETYKEGLGFMVGRQSNSKTYKIEKAIKEQLKSR